MTLGRTYHAVALDIGPASVAACQLASARRRVSLHRCALVEDALRTAPNTDAGDTTMLERAARLIEQAGFRGRRAVLALKPPDVSFHAVAAPDALRDAPRAQVLTALRFEAARQAQCAPDALEVDYWRLPAGNRSGNNVMVAAVRSDVLERWVGLVQSLGLELSRVDGLPCALLRAARVCHLPADDAIGDSVWGVLDIGFSGALLALALGNVCVYVRALGVTGDSLTRALADTMTVDYGVAEGLKRRFRAAGALVGAPGDGAAAAFDMDVQPVIEPIIRARTRQLATEIERAFGYALENYPRAAPAALYLCGGGARLGGLSESLHEHLGIDVRTFDPAAAIPGDEKSRRTPPLDEARGALTAASIGAALGDLS